MNREKTKLAFNNLPPDNVAKTGVETVWGELISPNTLVVMNTPFHMTGVSFLDEVSFAVEDGSNVFKSIVKKSGHSTYRILQFEKQLDKFEEYWKPIQKLGCSFESGKFGGGSFTLYAIDVPPEVDVNEAYALMERGEKDEVWHFEEGDFGHEKRN